MDPKSYELAYQAAAFYRAGKDRRAVHAALMAKLASIGMPKDEPTGNPDLVFMTLPADAADASLELEVRERDMLVAAIDAVDWPGFALANVRRAVDLLENADRPATSATT